jgi:AcrR family transcriptional regulator
MTTRKDELTAALVDYLLAHGLSELSLRPLAAELGTSARLLIYHYGSKEGLLAAAMQAMHAHLRNSLKALAQAKATAGAKPLRRFWDWALAPKNLPYLKLLYELQVLSARNPAIYGPLLQEAAADWLEEVMRIMPDGERDAATASLPIAVFDGLFLELMITGDKQRTTRAIDRFIQITEQARLHRAAGKSHNRSTRKRGA